MRTTLTLDDDIAERLRELSRRRRTTFTAVVNSVLRRALSTQGRRGPSRKRYRAATFRSAFRPGVDPLRSNQLADDLESARFTGKR